MIKFKINDEVVLLKKYGQLEKGETGYVIEEDENPNVCWYCLPIGMDVLAVNQDDLDLVECGVKPIITQRPHDYRSSVLISSYLCGGGCDYPLLREYNYCPKCGKEVNWEILNED